MEDNYRHFRALCRDLIAFIDIGRDPDKILSKFEFKYFILKNVLRIDHWLRELSYSKYFKRDFFYIVEILKEIKSSTDYIVSVESLDKGVIAGVDVLREDTLELMIANIENVRECVQFIITMKNEDVYPDITLSVYNSTNTKVETVQLKPESEFRLFSLFISYYLPDITPEEGNINRNELEKLCNTLYILCMRIMLDFCGLQDFWRECSRNLIYRIIMYFEEEKYREYRC